MFFLRPKITEKIGHGPHNFRTVFSWYFPDYVPDSGALLPANLVSPEAQVITLPNTIALKNGMFSLIKYGLSICNDGFGKNLGFGNCADDGLYQSSIGHLTYDPAGLTADDHISDLDLLLTGGRLSNDSKTKIVTACSSEQGKAATRCMQQLIITTPEYATTNHAIQTGEERITESSGEINATEPYKAMVFLFLDGALDSYNMLTPYTCSPIDVYDRYRTARGKTDISDGVGLPLNRLMEIDASTSDQACSSFGIHENLPILEQLYRDGHLNFIVNAGILAEPIDISNYTTIDIQLFAHNSMEINTKKNDLRDVHPGTGFGGRVKDVLESKHIPTDTFSIFGQQTLFNGIPAERNTAAYVLEENGLAEFNANPSISNMEDVMRSLNTKTVPTSPYFADTWSSKFSSFLSQQVQLKAAVDGTTVFTEFPSSSIGQQLQLVTQLMQTRDGRGKNRDIFYVQDSGYDHHTNLDTNLIKKFTSLNEALAAFVAEVKYLNHWNDVVLIQSSEMARTLEPNTNDGTDHAW